MQSYKKLLTTFLLASLPIPGITQEFKANLFVRAPQVVHYNFNQNEIGYSPVISVGTGLSHKSKFIELATFINESDVYGFYTFFGTTLATKEVGSNWKLHTNYFGEVAYVPKQSADAATFTYTTGLCFFLNYRFEWGSIGLPLCVGIAYNQKNLSLNTRTILNLSLNLN